MASAAMPGAGQTPPRAEGSEMPARAARTPRPTRTRAPQKFVRMAAVVVVVVVLVVTGPAAGPHEQAEPRKGRIIPQPSPVGPKVRVGAALGLTERAELRRTGPVLRRRVVGEDLPLLPPPPLPRLRQARPTPRVTRVNNRRRRTGRTNRVSIDPEYRQGLGGILCRPAAAGRTTSVSGRALLHVVTGSPRRREIEGAGWGETRPGGKVKALRRRKRGYWGRYRVRFRSPTVLLVVAVAIGHRPRKVSLVTALAVEGEEGGLRVPRQGLIPVRCYFLRKVDCMPYSLCLVSQVVSNVWDIQIDDTKNAYTLCARRRVFFFHFFTNVNIVGTTTRTKTRSDANNCSYVYTGLACFLLVRIPPGIWCAWHNVYI